MKKEIGVIIGFLLFITVLLPGFASDLGFFVDFSNDVTEIIGTPDNSTEITAYVTENTINHFLSPEAIQTTVIVGNIFINLWCFWYQNHF